MSFVRLRYLLVRRDYCICSLRRSSRLSSLVSFLGGFFTTICGCRPIQDHLHHRTRLLGAVAAGDAHRCRHERGSVQLFARRSRHARSHPRTGPGGRQEQAEECRCVYVRCTRTNASISTTHALTCCLRLGSYHARHQGAGNPDRVLCQRR